ncbi:MAG: gluconate 2-dehydrogenase subunit 3 family protein [Saprospiraceae bacterium]|nr:gluconate 2-dehydrogenase subunit 3 family protein [Saprospiraceae bacterium]MCF8249541.1 gluconate 2-dehydrogenase subunit 3 family protein [Saprospiraceae bacterium]MCF8281291.1 gluconate 2-dehydrogenase subunit 3 family protein [Bacteroidales bacterium]MCF8310759.1 gluconate 2-dehydrogenase subunit 3 family protein [Saprospiraceae bacterium]MCF8439410.1 gluconate 2-dehydrogenase subunit 3 family protein [Saprospiraceae bacterium]
MNRRDAIKQASILLGGALSAGAISGVMSGCKADPKIDWSPKYFTTEEGSLVEAIVERIIPKTDTPGAKDAGVHTFIDQMMADFYQEKDKAAFKDGLSKVEAEAKSAHGKSFVSLTPEQQDEVLTKIDKEAYDPSRKKDDPPLFFKNMKELTVLGFCTSEVGATEFLKYDPVPRAYHGCIPYSEVGAAWATS